MNKAQEIQEKTKQILDEVNEQLKLYTQDEMQMMYAKQMIEHNVDFDATDEQSCTTFKNEKDRQRLTKMLADAKLKWSFASDKQKKTVTIIQAIMAHGNERIKELYV